jgi:predicted peptidase
MKKKILIPIILLIAVFTLFACRSNETTQDSEEQEPEAPQEEITYTEAVEAFTVIDGQTMYYTYPSMASNQTPPKLVIFSHGQLQRVVKNLSDEYMLKLRVYGEFFSANGYAFSASNQHDDNWGQSESLRDIENSINWFEENNLKIDEKIYMIGFSMGGLTTINYAFKNPQDIAAIALLAPTRRQDLTQEHVNLLKDIPITIWHGFEDVNIPYSSSTIYVNSFKSFSKDVPLIPVANAGHYDVETTQIENILEFFEN